LGVLSSTLIFVVFEKFWVKNLKNFKKKYEKKMFFFSFCFRIFDPKTTNVEDPKYFLSTKNFHEKGSTKFGVPMLGVTS
jgi:hypothetical protein